MDFIRTIDSISSTLPADLGKMVALEIKQPCLVVDAFQILDNYPNIKHIKVCGHNYTSQEVKQMGIGEMLGGKTPESAVLEWTVAIPGPTIAVENIAEDQEPVPAWQPSINPAQRTIFHQPAPGPYPGIYEQLQAAAPTPGQPLDINRAIQQVYEIQRERRRNDQYTQAMQGGMRQYQQDYYGQWRDNVTTARPMTATEVTNQNAIRGTTTDMVWYDEPITNQDYYYVDPSPAM